MLIDTMNVLQCVKVGQLIFRPIQPNGKPDNVNVNVNMKGSHHVKKFVRTEIHIPNQNIFEPVVSHDGYGIITWLLDANGQPYTETTMPNNWYALRVRKEASRSAVLNATILETDDLGMEYYAKWREEIAKIFDDHAALEGQDFELFPSGMRVWFKPVYDKRTFDLWGFDAQLIQCGEPVGRQFGNAPGGISGTK